MKQPLLPVAAILGMVSVGGCIFSFNPYGRQISQIQTRIINLDARIERVEIASAAGGAAAGGEIGSSVPGAIVTESAVGGGSTVVAGPAVGGEAGGERWPGLAFNFRRAIGKLGRGLVNALTGWVEIPKGIHDTTQRYGALSGLTLGTLRGAGYGFIRTAAGAYETVTFPFPAPPHYRPVMKPEFIFTCECPEGAPSP